MQNSCTMIKIEEGFRKARLVTNPQERTNMTGAKPNVQIVKDAIYNWNNPQDLYDKYNSKAISNVRCAVRAIIKQYLDDNIWTNVRTRTLPYNTKGAACIVQESYQYLVDLFEGDIRKIFEVKYGRRGLNKVTKKTAQLLELVEAAQPIEPIVMIDTRVEDALKKKLKVFLIDADKYDLTKEQIVSYLNRLLT